MVFVGNSTHFAQVSVLVAGDNPINPNGVRFYCVRGRQPLAMCVFYTSASTKDWNPLKLLVQGCILVGLGWTLSTFSSVFC